MPRKKQPSPCSGLTLPWTGPGDMVAIEQTLDLLFHVSILKYLELCIQKFPRNKRGKKAFRWQSRWLSVKVKSKAVDDISSFSIKATLKADAHLDTIYEDSDMSLMRSLQ
ncbi:hypothetical protein MTR_2g060590 [Medicago truncatula]|uniref:Uncharacterized protein n=1 Tax=Medicago truncatula TaxID=3880 RepID=G7IIZ0_MEDTR|nr:hypothetical protein MTR_2g060590 [Medicago truncatula]